MNSIGDKIESNADDIIKDNNFLFAAYQKAAADFAQKDYAAKYQALHDLKDVISAYFDETMVMAKDEHVKNNRLTQLSLLADLTKAFGSLDKLNIK